MAHVDHTHASLLTGHSALLTELGVHIPPPPRRGAGNRIAATDADFYQHAMHQALGRLLGHCASLKQKLQEEKASFKALQTEQEAERKAKAESDTRLQLLVSNFERLVDDAYSCDIVFDAQGNLIHAHSSIVGLWSMPFRVMLESQMQEGINKKITITTEEHTYVKEMVKYFYTADVNLNRSSVLPLLRLACLYQIDSLRDKCFDYLEEHMESEHCIPLFHMASMHHETEVTERWDLLFQICCNHIRDNKYSVLASSGSPFRGLDLAFVVTILQKTVESGLQGHLQTSSNKLIGSALLAWGKENWGVGDLPELINFINSEVARNKIQVFVKATRSLVFLLSRDKKVKELKAMIASKEAIPTTFQWLVFNGKVLQDELSLQECGIQNDSTIQLCTRAGHGVTKTKTEVEEYVDERPEMWKSLHDYCLTAIIADFEQQWKCAGFLKLDVGTLSHILQQDDLMVSSEGVVLAALVSWISVSPHTRGDSNILSRLLSLVRFPFIELETLMDIPRLYPTIGGCPFFKPLLQEALQFQFSQTQPHAPMPHKRNSSAMEDTIMADDNSNLRMKKRKFYTNIPEVNMNQFFSCVVSSVVPRS